MPFYLKGSWPFRAHDPDRRVKDWSFAESTIFQILLCESPIAQKVWIVATLNFTSVFPVQFWKKLRAVTLWWSNICNPDGKRSYSPENRLRATQVKDSDCHRKWPKEPKVDLCENEPHIRAQDLKTPTLQPNREFSHKRQVWDQKKSRT